MAEPVVFNAELAMRFGYKLVPMDQAEDERDQEQSTAVPVAVEEVKIDEQVEEISERERFRRQLDCQLSKLIKEREGQATKEKGEEVTMDTQEEDSEATQKDVGNKKKRQIFNSAIPLPPSSTESLPEGGCCVVC